MPRVSVLVFSILLALICGCASDASIDVVPSEVGSPKDEHTIQAAAANLNVAQTRFGAGLFQQLKSDENLLFSPYSVHVALGMTMAGAKGNTAGEMSSALHTAQGAATHSAFAQQINALSTVNTRVAVPLHFSTANRLWPHEDYPFHDAYMELLEARYGAAPQTVNYVSATEDARQEINGWVSEQTKSKIPELIKPGVLTVDTRLVLSNAVYFKGAWSNLFEEHLTKKRDFHGISGTTQVDTMENTDTFALGKVDGHDVIALPYQGGDADMLIVVPKSGDFTKFRDGLDAGVLGRIMTPKLTSAEVHLRLPKFTFRSPSPLKEPLKEMGMKALFEPGDADLSGMSPRAKSDGLHVSAVVHEAFIDVNEKGTEAAAATAVVVSLESAMMPQTTVDFLIDRPFFFVIRHKKTNTPLFIGQVTQL